MASRRAAARNRTAATMATSTTTTTSSSTTTTLKPRIRLGSRSYTYHVESKTRPGAFYVVDAHHLTCTCPAGRARRGCWHLRLGLAWHDWRKRQQATAADYSARPTGMAALQEAVA
jgi:hypothetical protein